jgi:RNA polymerase sigma-70 factor (sigma-E family)
MPLVARWVGVSGRPSIRQAHDSPDVAAGVVLVSTSQRNADEAVTHLYAAKYADLVRLATLLIGDHARAQEIVQDAFMAAHGRWHRFRDMDKAAGYVSRSVVNRSRSELRHRAVMERRRPDPLPAAASAESQAVARSEKELVLAALDRLPRRQREVLVLRYYLELSEAEVASTLGISRGAVKSHSSRGKEALRRCLGATT